MAICDVQYNKIEQEKTMGRPVFLYQFTV
jgi:predicted ArsR family transcriptional regulator